MVGHKEASTQLRLDGEAHGRTTGPLRSGPIFSRTHTDHLQQQFLRRTTLVDLVCSTCTVITKRPAIKTSLSNIENAQHSSGSDFCRRRGEWNCGALTLVPVHACLGAIYCAIWHVDSRENLEASSQAEEPVAVGWTMGLDKLSAGRNSGNWQSRGTMTRRLEIS